MNIKKSAIILLFLILPLAASEENKEIVQKLEFSFGNSQMYIRDTERLDIANKERITLPTSSALLLGEYAFSKTLGAMLTFNLPLTTQKFIVDDEVKEEKASPYLGLGPRWAPLQFKVFNRAIFEPQLGALMGIMFRENWALVPVPVIAGRLHLSAKDGFTMYVGTFFIVGIRALTIFYGVGHRF